MPYPIASLSDDTQVLTVADLEDVDALTAQLDAAYPAISTGTAWVSRVGGRIYINNAHENSDIAQDFSIEIEGWGTLSGTVQPHSYAMVRVADDALWVMANADTKGPYTDRRQTEIRLQIEREPSVVNHRGTATTAWAAGASTVHLDHADGAGEISYVRD